VINNLLDKEKCDYDYLFWIDADALFNKHDIPLETFITDPDKNIIICDDIPNSGKKDTINTGTFFVKCTDWSRDFFKYLWSYNGKYLYDHYHEQTIMEIAISDNTMNAKNNILVQSADTFNSTFSKLFDEDYKRNNFILHIMGTPADTRINYMNDWLSKNGYSFDEK